MAAYYNEFDHEKAAWLRELIKRNLIAQGEVDERDINDIAPNELMGFTQHHFFAGVGIWSYSLRKAGWPDDRPIWTASCPCQPFSAAGKGDGFDDERHLWPSLFWLIQQFRPVKIIGEQVASKDGRAWFDLVQTDLEGAAYSSGAVNSCAAGYGAPELRQRLYWMAYPESGGSGPGLCHSRSREERRILSADNGGNGRVADTGGERQQGCVESRRVELQRRERQVRPTSKDCVFGQLADADNHGFDQGRGCIPTTRNDGVVGNSTTCSLADPEEGGRRKQCENLTGSNKRGGKEVLEQRPRGGCVLDAPGPVNGLWRDADWIFCRDEKWRPVEPGTFPLAHGAPARVVRLRGYGDGIVAPQAQAFIEAVMGF